MSFQVIIPTLNWFKSTFRYLFELPMFTFFSKLDNILLNLDDNDILLLRENFTPIKKHFESLNIKIENGVQVLHVIKDRNEKKCLVCVFTHLWDHYEILQMCLWYLDSLRGTKSMFHIYFVYRPHNCMITFYVNIITLKLFVKLSTLANFSHISCYLFKNLLCFRF